MEAAGGLRIVKTSEDGNVSGIEFTITGEDYSERVRTGSDGTIDVTGLMPGRYTVAEINSDAYTPQDSQTVTIAGGESAVVTFNNTLKRGALQVRKSAEDNFIEGVTFHLYGTSASGLEVDEYAVTGADGVAHFENVLISGNTPYTIEEVDTAERYVVPESQSVSILWYDVAERSFHNVLKNPLTSCESERIVLNHKPLFATARAHVQQTACPCIEHTSLGVVVNNHVTWA